MIMQTPQEKNKKLAKRLGFVALVMVGLSFASVPLYGLFCRVTGFGGQPQVAVKAPDKILERQITVRFNTDVAPNMPWTFKPENPPQKMHLGEVKRVNFSAENKSQTPIEGIAVYNVLPERAGLYFNKIQCFCFDGKTLKANERADFPVQFFIDPAIVDDPLLADVNTITLSYTFFEAKSAPLEKAQAAFNDRAERLLDALR